MNCVMPNATLMLAIMAFLIEAKQLLAFRFTPYSLWLLFLCGLTAFLTNYSGYVVIAKLSALTHQLLGQAKTCIILLVGHFAFGSTLGATQMGGASAAMVAMIAYTAFTIKQNEPSLPTTALPFQVRGCPKPRNEHVPRVCSSWPRPSPSQSCVPDVKRCESDFCDMIHHPRSEADGRMQPGGGGGSCECCYDIRLIATPWWHNALVQLLAHGP